MKADKVQQLDKKVDARIIKKLSNLNTKYRLGLSISNYPTHLKIPSYVRGDEFELWSPINAKITELHADSAVGRIQLSAVLESYKKWAKLQQRETKWIEKDQAEARLLGTPRRHAEQLKRLLGISRYSSGGTNKRRIDEISRTESAEMSWGDVAYPIFSEDAQDIINKFDSSRDHRSAADKSSLLYHDQPRTGSLGSTATEREEAHDDQRRKRLKPNASQPRTLTSDVPSLINNNIISRGPEGSLKSQASVQAVTTSADNSRHTSFNSFTSTIADIETPATSFGSNVPAKPGSMGPPATRKVEAVQPTSRTGTIPDHGGQGGPHHVSTSRLSPQADKRADWSDQRGSTPVNSSHDTSFSQPSQNTEALMLQLGESDHPNMLDYASQSTLAMGALPLSGQTALASQEVYAQKLTLQNNIVTVARPASTSSSQHRDWSSQHTRSSDVQKQLTSTSSASRRSSGVPHRGDLWVNGKDPFHRAALGAEHGHDFRSAYEISRIYLESKLEYSADSKTMSSQSFVKLSGGIQKPDDQGYETFFSNTLRMMDMSRTPVVRSSFNAWKAATSDSTIIKLGGKLNISVNKDRLDGQFTLSPIKIDKSYRLSRKFGADRFFFLDIPDIDDKSKLRETFNEWLSLSKHRFLGRTWRAFYLRPKKDNQERTAGEDKHPYQAILFAVDGIDIPNKKVPIRDIAPGVRSKILDYEMLDWLLNIRHNQDLPACKLFSRIGLGLTTTTAGIQFSHSQIIRTHDAWSCCPGTRSLLTDEKTTFRHKHSGKVMNDGCGRMSIHAALRIMQALKLEYLPSAFQGRIGGAKGVWQIDKTGEISSNGERIWIETTDSQHKFDAFSGRIDDLDPLHTTFDVHSHSYPVKSHTLGYSLIPILTNAGVPEQNFVQLLKDDLERTANTFDDALDRGGPVLLDWLQSAMPVATERISGGDLKIIGGFPGSMSEKVHMLTASGHLPTKDRFLWDTCIEIQKTLWERSDQKPELNVAKSTNVLMIPDPCNVLEEGEVFLQFSQPFQDESTGEPLHSLDDLPVLVARYPAYLASDIQKVRGVYKQELSHLKDVIVFSTKGDTSLAEYLSGGDFDGDKAWVCWEPRVLKNFQNSPLAEIPPPEYYGIEIEKQTAWEVQKAHGKRGLYRMGIKFNWRPIMLGRIANWFMGYSYHDIRHRPLDDANCILVAQLLGYLVDTAKNGYTFGDCEWRLFCLKQKLPLGARLRPAWKSGIAAGKRKDVVMDVMRFGITADHRKEKDCKYRATSKQIGYYDGGLSKLCRDAEELVEKQDEGRALKVVSDHLRAEFEDLFASWGKIYAGTPEGVDWLRSKTEAKKNTRPMNHDQRRQDVSELRRRFLGIAPPESSQHPSAANWRREAEYMLLSTDEWQERVGRVHHDKNHLNRDIKWPQQDRIMLTADFGAWTRLKASFLNREYSRRSKKFCYAIAGKELCDIKSLLTNVPSDVYSVTRGVYASLKVDKNFVKRLQDGTPAIAVADEDNDDILTQADMGDDELDYE